MIMELAMVNNMQDVNGNERFISVAPTWATITSAVRFHDKRQQAVDDEEDAAGRLTATLQFPLGAAVPSQLQSFDHARLFLLDDNIIHRDHAGDVSLNFQEVLNSLISPTDLQTIEYHESPQDELYCTSDHTAYCILDRSAGGGSPGEEGILSQAMYNNNVMLPQAAADHETNLPFIDLRDVSQSDDLQHLNHTYISCTHSSSDGDEGVQPSLTTQQMMIPVASFQTPLVFLTDSTVCGSRLLAEYSAVTHSVFAENGDEPIDQSTRPSNSLPPNTSSPPARKKRKRMLPMNSAVSLEAAESNQVADAECEVDSHGCKLDDSLLGGETWRRHWDVDMNFKCGEQENIQDEEFSSNLRNSETHTVKKGVAQNQHDAECLWHSGPEDAPQEISPHIQPGDSYTLETPTNSKVMYITCSAMEQRPCETMVGVEESTELAKDPEDMAPRNDTLMKLMGWSTEEASYEHEMPLNSCTSCWQLDEAQYEVQLPSLLESGRESSEKRWGCIPVIAERSIDFMDREPLLPSQHPGASSVEESIKGFFNDVPASSPNLNKRMTHSGGPEEIASSILNEGYPPEGCCAEDTGKGVLKTFISTGVNALSSLSPNGTIGLLGKFPQGQMELLNSPSNQLGYQESKLIVGHLMTSEATSIAREMGESWSTPSDLQTSVPDLKKKSLLNRQDVQILPAVITQRVSKLEVARAKQRPPRNRCKKPKGTRSEQALPDYNQIRGIPRDQHSLTTMQPSEKNDSLSLKSEGIDGEEKGGDRPLIVVKTSDSASKRSSQYRGVTRHRYTGRYEAHLWDNSKVKTGLSKRGRQVYLGAYQNEEQAARAHDSAALKYWGPGAFINFPIDEYKDQLIAMENFTKEEYILLIRRRSPGFARGRSKYRGVTRHHQDGRWEARIGREPGAKYHYLGIFDTQEEAAMAYDRAAVECRGVNAVTNFQLSSHLGDTNKSPSHPAVPHGGEKSSEADSQGPAYDPNHEPAVSGTSLQKLREEDLSMSSQVLNSIDWLSPSVVLRIPMYRSRVLLPPSCELEGMITKACEALEGRVITGTTRNLSKMVKHSSIQA